MLACWLTWCQNATLVPALLLLLLSNAAEPNSEGRVLPARRCHMLLGENKSCSEEEQVLWAGMLCSVLTARSFCICLIQHTSRASSIGGKAPPISPLGSWREGQPQQAVGRAFVLLMCPDTHGCSGWGLLSASDLSPPSPPLLCFSTVVLSNTISQCKALLLSLQHACVWGFWGLIVRDRISTSKETRAAVMLQTDLAIFMVPSGSAN